MDPVRTCLGCRARVGKSSLMRVVARNGELVVDHSATLSGRGAWVHPTRECVETAIKRKAFGRALRVAGAIQDGAVERLRQAVRPPAVEPTAVEPTAVEPTAVEPPAVQPPVGTPSGESTADGIP